MSNYDLSILIPARNEMFIAKTVEDLLANIEGNTEILVGLDGAWADPGIKSDPRVTLVYYPESIGQRAMTNQLCKISRAKYVMKADAHTAWDKGFDVKMLEAFKEVGDDVTMVPIMKNLHAFDWVCPDGHRRYQSPSGACLECGKPTEREMAWKPRHRTPNSTAYRFDTTMHFQYHNDWKKHQKGDLVETMSLQGSCFMLTREKYWELEICDENFGSWGQQGVEVACKTWLSGGRVICNKRTWYAHMFRTQGGDFGMPYPLSQGQIDHAREFSRELFQRGKWPQAVHNFQWLLDKFAPLPGWHDDTKERPIGDSENVWEIPDKEKKGIIFFTDNRLNLKVAHAVQNQLKSIGLFIVSSSLKPMTFGDKNVVIDGERGYHTYFRQIVAALETLTTKYVFFCEHDVLYPPSHFEFTPPHDDKFYYDQNWVKIRLEDGFAVRWDADQVSGLVCDRQLALNHYTKMLAAFERDNFDRKFEPGSGTDQAESWKAPDAYVDIRHGRTLTKSKWSLDDFRDKTTAKNFEITKCPDWAKDILPNINGD